MSNLRKYFLKVNFALNIPIHKIEDELRDFIEQIFLKKIIADEGSINYNSMINFMKKEIQMSDALETKAVQLIVQNLEQESNLRNLVSKIRLY